MKDERRKTVGAYQSRTVTALDLPRHMQLDDLDQIPPLRLAGRLVHGLDGVTRVERGELREGGPVVAEGGEQDREHLHARSTPLLQEADEIRRAQERHGVGADKRDGDRHLIHGPDDLGLPRVPGPELVPGDVEVVLARAQTLLDDLRPAAVVAAVEDDDAGAGGGALARLTRQILERGVGHVEHELRVLDDQRGDLLVEEELLSEGAAPGIRARGVIEPGQLAAVEQPADPLGEQGTADAAQDREREEAVLGAGDLFQELYRGQIAAAADRAEAKHGVLELGRELLDDLRQDLGQAPRDLLDVLLGLVDIGRGADVLAEELGDVEAPGGGQGDVRFALDPDPEGVFALLDHMHHVLALDPAEGEHVDAHREIVGELDQRLSAAR